MCTTEPPRRRQTIHKTIIREIEHTVSSESGCVSDDDLSRSISRHFTDAQTQTVPTFCTNSRCRTSNRSRSVGDILDESQLVSSKLPTNQCKFQRFNREPFQAFSSNLVRKGKDNQHTRLITSRMSRSLENLSLPTLPMLREKTTIDSGTEDSIQQLSSQVLVQPVHYELVRVHGCQPALMIKRYDFDPVKVREYHRKAKPNAAVSLPQTTHPYVEPIRTTARRHTSGSLSKTKSGGFRSLFHWSRKSSSKDSLPIYRHHSRIDEGQ